LFWKTGPSVCLKVTFTLSCTCYRRQCKILYTPRPSPSIRPRCGTCGGSLPVRNVFRLPPVMQSDIYNPRRHVGVHAEHISDVSSRDFPGHYPGEDNSWNLDLFRQVCAQSPLASSLELTVRPHRNYTSRLIDCRSGLSNLTLLALMRPSRTLSGGYS